MDVPKILRRHPEVCVVDGLAYDNPPGSLHQKRWQDVETLLAAGISVMGSVNLQHIAEYREKAEKITGKQVKESLPLDFLRSADEIEVVDAPAEMCLERASGSSDPGREPERGRVAIGQQKLSELREMALLLTADIVDRQLEEYLRRHNVHALWGTQERILVCIKAGTNAHRMIESGQRNANRFHGELFVAHVRQPATAPRDQAMLEKNLDGARARGAQVELLDGEDWVQAILGLARARGVTQIFIIHSRKENWRERLFGSAVDRLIKAAEGIDIRVFPH